MEFVIHAAITAVALLLVSKFLRGFEIDSLFTAIVTALILGLLHALIAPWIEHLGRFSARVIGAASLSYPVAVGLIVLSMLVVNALVLTLAAAVGPGFRISDMKTAIVGALLLAIFNALIGAGIDFVGQLARLDLPRDALLEPRARMRVPALPRSGLGIYAPGRV